jgi:DNA-binding LacI/PurR family transcriptional regulator
VRVPFFEMGVRAAQKLIDVINGQEPGRSTPEPLLKTELVVRESSFKEGSE